MLMQRRLSVLTCDAIRAVNRALVPHVLERSQRIERVERVEEKKMLQFELPAEKRGAEEVEVKTEEAAKARGGAEVESEKRGEIRSKADLRALLPRVAPLLTPSPLPLHSPTLTAVRARDAHVMLT